MGSNTGKLIMFGILTTAVTSLALAVVGGRLAADVAATSPAAAGRQAPTSTFVTAPGASVPPSLPADVLTAPRADAPIPTTAGLQRAVTPLLATAVLGAAVSVDVVDVSSGNSLMSVNPTRPMVPASTAKLLTGAAALTAVGPQTTLTTRVVDGVTPGEVVLVGGGDVLLGAGRGNPDRVVGRAGLADLADQTAAALRAAGRTSVAVRLDDALFRGPAVHPGWRPGDVAAGYVAPVMALEVNAGQIPRRTARQNDPALAAGQAFATLLARRGVRVTASVVRAQAPASSAVLGSVQSAPVARLVEYALTESDNTVAEALGRLVALHSGRQATFTDAGSAVLDRVGLLGVPTKGNQLAGGSGLADGSAVSARTLTGLLALAGSSRHPELRPLLTGLPVAGASGTLATRFSGSRQHGGLGVVRAKTGTLKGVNSLAGTVVDADGRQLAFAIMADRTGATTGARSALDAVAVALARCGCR